MRALIVLFVAIALWASRLEDAKRLYGHNSYEKAYLILKSDYLNHLQEPLYQFYLGLCAEELGKYSEAIVAFERVLMLDPKNIRTKLELARSYYLLNRYDESITLFRELLRYKLPPSVKEKIYHYLALMESKEYSLEALVSFAIGYDSNVLNSANVDRYRVPKFQLDFNNSVEKVSDILHKEYITVNMAKDYEDSILKLETSFYFKSYKEYSSQNFAYGSIKPAILKGRGEIGLFYEKLFYGSDPYLYNLGVFGRYDIGNGLKIELKAWREFDEGDLNRKKDAKIFELLYTSSIETPWALHYYEAAFRKKMKIYSDQSDVSYDQWRFFIESQIRRMGVGLEFDRTNYKDIDPFFLTRRHENYYNVYLYYLFPLQNYYLKTIIGYIYNNSNQAVYKYKKVYFDLEIGGRIK